MSFRSLARQGVPYTIERELEAELGRPPTALEKLAAIDEIRDNLLLWQRAIAKAARDGGATWQEIGEALGISRQAAQQRLAPS